MKVTAIKSLAEYDSYCREYLPNKIPQCGKDDWKLRLGDCIYDYSDCIPTQRKGVHNEDCRKIDLRGCYALLSNCFYYFGSEAKEIPSHLSEIIKKGRGHKNIKNFKIISSFEEWLSQFEQNKLYSDPINSWAHKGEVSDEIISKCSRICVEENIEESLK